MSGLKRVLAFCLCLVLLAGFLPRETFAASSDATLVKRNGVWYYVKDGRVCYDTTLVKFNGSWWYVTGGKVASNATTLVKFNGSWWYIIKGKLASSTTTLVKFNGSWWYIVKGKLASNTTTLVKWNGSWWYIVKGKLASNTTTLVKFNGSWYYVNKGKVAFDQTTLCPFNGQTYYVRNGVAMTWYTGYVQYQGRSLYLYKGAVRGGQLPPPVDQQIPEGAFEYKGHHYQIYENVCGSWEEAYKYCTSLGGHLATFSSKEENDAVYAYICSLGYKNAYFGYSDSLQEGTWSWADDIRCDYQNWHSGEPNNEGRTENYAMFYWKFSDGTWNDGNFGRGTERDDRNFICEWD